MHAGAGSSAWSNGNPQDQGQVVDEMANRVGTVLTLRLGDGRGDGRVGEVGDLGRLDAVRDDPSPRLSPTKFAVGGGLMGCPQSGTVDRPTGRRPTLERGQLDTVIAARRPVAGGHRGGGATPGAGAAAWSPTPNCRRW